MATAMASSSPREHIEKLRTITFSIGREVNPLASMLDKAVEYLSAELYTKDVHFLMELIQNAEDNEYPEGVDPSLEFVITTHDITKTGAPATLLIFNNEKGFTAKNIESICNVGNSTKKGNRKRGYIGEKGIGFKSVFLISAQPYIFSSGYQIRFNEKPCPDCKLGYIVPEWVEDSPSLSDIQQIYGCDSSVPATTIVLPLKPDKMEAVKQQLSSIHPEVLLFLSKIKHLSVREDNEDPSLNTVNAIAITKETNFVTRKNIDAESYTLYLSADANGDVNSGECSYYIWKQKFPVNPENRVDRRTEVEDWMITLAFPITHRLQRGTSSPGVFAFLPTEMVTNFPFIIQADFILASSRETILFDNKWNRGIFGCVPTAFVNALVSLVTSVEAAPLSNLPQMFEFLPVRHSTYPQLNDIRESIKEKLAAEDIIPIESYTVQNFFRKPREVGRLMHEFWNILKKAKDEGVSLDNISSHDIYVLCSSFDQPEYDEILNFMGVGMVNSEWYTKCIRGSNLVMGVSDDTYVELLIFLADNWQSKFQSTAMFKIPLIRYVSADGSVCLGSINESTLGKLSLCMAEKFNYASWLIDWNKEFRCEAKWFFLPKSTQLVVLSSCKAQVVWNWLTTHAKVTLCSVYKYATVISNHISADRKLAITYAYFLQSSFSSEYLSESEVKYLCGVMPLVDNYGHVRTMWSAVLVPAKGSEWVQLIGSNPWRNEGYVELGEDYFISGIYAGQKIAGNALIKFLKDHLGAADVPHVSPPDAGIPTVSSPLTKLNAFLLLEWIRHLRNRVNGIPQQFLNCIKNGSWLRITMNGFPGKKPPSQAFLLSSNRGNSSWGSIMQNGSVLVDIPLIDKSFYGDEIDNYKEELRTIGVMFEYGEACEFIGKHLMFLAASSTLTRSHVISMLNFIRFLKGNMLSPEKFISSVKGGRWLRTSCGCQSPVETVLYDDDWKHAKEISDIPFVDREYYGDEILNYKSELNLLGVIVGFSGNYKLVIHFLRPSSSFSGLTAEALRLVLDCLRHSESADKLVSACKGSRCMKTNLGYKYPSDCFLFDSEWGCLLEVFGGSLFTDHSFYGSNINSYKLELKQLGVKVDFEDAVKVFISNFKEVRSYYISKNNVFSFLSCYRKLKGSSYKLPSDLKECVREAKWLKTKLGDYRSPKDCILFGPDWESISPITLLPFVDDSDSCYGKSICEYKKELESLGVVVGVKEGLKFVVYGLRFPQNPSIITPANVLSLLECIRNYLQVNPSLPEDFLKRASGKWLLTNAGYAAPNMCCLFDSTWGSYLKQTDGPFIDAEFYGSKFTSYKRELGAMGVIVDFEKGCSLLASQIYSHSDFAAILRIYEFLIQYKSKSESKGVGSIWIPFGDEDGKWVDPVECVLHDKDNLFGSQLNVLERYYQQRLLNFFSGEFGVKNNPSVDDYCKLWKTWEKTGHELTHSECYAFWGWVIKQKSPKVEKSLASDLTKLPVLSDSGKILLFDKQDIFIADDLQLRDLFNKFASRPVFVWYPQPSMPSLSQGMLLEMYRKIGVHTISESAQMEEIALEDGEELEQKSASDIFIGKELIRLILGFLADSSRNMEVKTRHEAVECLLNLSVFETRAPIGVIYALSLSSGVEKATANQTLRWDKKSCKLFTQQMNRSGGKKSLIEYASCFSRVIAEGVLREKEDLIYELTELIKFAFLLNFDEGAVDFLMKSKNLQIFMEDEEFLSAAFPSN